MREAGVKEFRIVTHTPQPFTEPFDLEAPVETIMRATEQICRSRPGFTSRAEWRAMQGARMTPAG